MGTSTNVNFLVSISVFVGFISLVSLAAITQYPEMAFIIGIDPAVFATELLVVAGTCVIATGIPCAGALIIFTTINVWVATDPIIATLITAPLFVGLAYLVARLARGVG